MTEVEKNRIKGKFKDVPDDRGTIVLHSDFDRIGGFDVKFEFWTYSTYAGVSAIFLREDIKSLSRQELIDLVKKEC